MTTPGSGSLEYGGRDLKNDVKSCVYPLLLALVPSLVLS